MLLLVSFKSNLFACSLSTLSEALAIFVGDPAKPSLNHYIFKISSSPNSNFLFECIENSTRSHITSSFNSESAVNKARHLSLYYMIAIIILTFNDHTVTLNLNCLCIRDYRDIKVLRDLGPILCCITINSLTTCNDQIVINVSIVHRQESLM